MEHHHDTVYKWASSLIGQHRHCLGIEPKWIITIGILCPLASTQQEELPHATVSWIPDCYEAEMCVRCDLPYGVFRRSVIHELVELSWYRTGTLYDQVSVDLGDLFTKQYRIARNQEVELLVDLYLNETREALTNVTKAQWPQRHRRWSI